MVLVRQATPAVEPALQWVWDLEKVPPWCAWAMAWPFRLLFPCTAERLIARPPWPAAALPPTPRVVEDWVGEVEVPPIPRVDADVPPAAALPPEPPVAEPTGPLDGPVAAPTAVLLVELGPAPAAA